MTKQELAREIWAMANEMRGNIEANDYKDYILGFLFYKYLSDKQDEYFASKNVVKDEDKKQYLVALAEAEKKGIASIIHKCKKDLGYYIAYENLFSTWIKNYNPGDDLSDKVSTALNSFERSILEKYEESFKDIFKDLQVGIQKLGNTAYERSEAIWNICNLINKIPITSKQDYDILGFVYEYLISMFAANAGKKAGEFYTPHEVSQLMSVIAANHLKGLKNVSIYDPTSGSGSLLITLGRELKKIDKNVKIQYYAQEVIYTTYNITRMNLLMNDVHSVNMFAKCGDTLKEDWPFVYEEQKYKSKRTDAVVSNPPYSLAWNTENKENDPRFRYGLAPKSKSELAFLLHSLYHLEDHGILTIVLPHGVLFRGGSELQIRQNLISHDHIDAIIGLPSNIFFGTGIPTIIMVLKRSKTKKEKNNVLFIDASKYFTKEGNKNKLQSSDIVRIYDAFSAREDIPGFARVVSHEEIKANEYNLNIPKYIDLVDNGDNHNLYSSIFSGIPHNDIDKLSDFWSTFPTLKKALLNDNGKNYQLKDHDVEKVISNNEEVKKYLSDFNKSLESLRTYFKKSLIDTDLNVIDLYNVYQQFLDKIQSVLKSYKLLDYYQAFQLFDNEWTIIENDLKVIKSADNKNSFDTIRELKEHDSSTISAKADKKLVSKNTTYGIYQTPVIPFEFVTKLKFNNQLEALEINSNKVEEINARLEELLNEVAGYESDVVNNFYKKEENKLNFDEIKKQLKNLSVVAKSQPESVEALLVEALSIDKEKRALNSAIRKAKLQLEKNTIQAYSKLTDEEAKTLLCLKWIDPLISAISKSTKYKIENLASELNRLDKKYIDKLSDLEVQIIQTQNSLIELINELEGPDLDMEGLNELKKILGNK
ncbi:type I restriction-modification system subunit M [Mycoplasmoides gallisepticum]|nr:type I restriction-modification system subunit M [Mycoplasmoides gallisepticum]